MASMYDKFAGQAAFHELLGTELVARSKWIGIDLEVKDLRVLDYACGTGAVSQVVRLIP
jgi:ubiquinone/menaquinone biosynthesis C-methylase UbiE